MLNRCMAADIPGRQTHLISENEYTKFGKTLNINQNKKTLNRNQNKKNLNKTTENLTEKQTSEGELRRVEDRTGTGTGTVVAEVPLRSKKKTKRRRNAGEVGEGSRGI